ncbi:MAG TPA: PIG-L family deacetylase [Humisphaera sp.]|nr:PIG-L family deacetylase [Humisphaera sp.]
MNPVTRRQLLAATGIATAASVLPADAAQGLPATIPSRPLKVVVAGAHPDDPESGCGGTILRYTAAGHAVAIVYLTRGEAGIPGKAHHEAAAIRTAEAEKACKIMGATPVFAGQIDGSTEVTRDRYAEYFKLIEEQKPDVIFTHWPIDTHLDHRACSMLTYHAWLKLGRHIPLYYFEVDLGGQTSLFHPTDYVDVTATVQAKQDACFCHISQNAAAGFWAGYHEPMLRFRGMESGYKSAEAFVHHSQSAGGNLPSINRPE